MAQERFATHYDNLKVARNSPPEVIRAAYRALAQKCHPDRYSDQVQANRIMKILNEAYAVLSDVDRRREHDTWIAEQDARIAAEEGQRTAAIGRHARESARAHEGRSSRTSAGAGGVYPGAAAEGRFNDAARFRQDGGKGSPDVKGMPQKMPWWQYVIVLMLVPFVVAGRVLKWLFNAIEIAFRWLVWATLIALVVGVIWTFKEVWDSKPSTVATSTSPAPNAAAPGSAPRFSAANTVAGAPRQRSLQDDVREIVADARRNLPRRLTDEIWLIAVDEAQNQVIRTYDLVGNLGRDLTSSEIRALQLETDENFRSVCRNKHLLPLLQRGMSFALIYRLAETKKTVLTMVHSIRDC